MTYALNDKTLFRAGWGIFYDRAFYPGWGGGISQDGFTSNAAFSSTPRRARAGFLPAEQGFPQNFAPPPFIQSDYQNGQGIYYRPLDANERPRSQQWNLTLDREIGQGLHGGRSPTWATGARTCPPTTSP